MTVSSPEAHNTRHVIRDKVIRQSKPTPHGITSASVISVFRQSTQHTAWRKTCRVITELSVTRLHDTALLYRVSRGLAQRLAARRAKHAVEALDIFSGG